MHYFRDLHRNGIELISVGRCFNSSWLILNSSVALGWSAASPQYSLAHCYEILLDDMEYICFKIGFWKVEEMWFFIWTCVLSTWYSFSVSFLPLDKSSHSCGKILIKSAWLHFVTQLRRGNVPENTGVMQHSNQPYGHQGAKLRWPNIQFCS